MFNACYNGSLNIMKYLIEHGLDINKENIIGYTPISNACCEGHISRVNPSKMNISK